MADEERDLSALFEDPKDFYEQSKPFTYQEYSLLSGKTFTVRLVGHNPLWVRHL